MGDTSIAFRQGDYAPGLDGVFIKRVQEFEVSPVYPREQVNQLGSAESVGSVAESTDHRGRIRAYGIDNTIETAFGGLTPTLWQAHTGSSLAGPVKGITGAKLTRVEYTCRVGGFFECTYDCYGTGSSAGSTFTGSTAGRIANRSKDINVKINGVESVRAQSFRVTVDMQPAEVRELNNENVVGRVFDSPMIDVEVEFLESTAIAGAAEFTGDSAGSIVIEVNGSDKILTLNNVRSTETPHNARVKDFGRRTYRYRSDANTADGGLTLS
ncbi:MAG: hypothetical protein EHM35_18005 [Planctomycetaceae bacterium]|nr:MAG: hypothetical protein EHM35_18005 [Planctomycetaceae bacterium]